MTALAECDIEAAASTAVARILTAPADGLVIRNAEHPGPVTMYLLRDHYAIPAWLRDACAADADPLAQALAAEMKPAAWQADIDALSA